MLGIGECITVTEDPSEEPEKGEVVWDSNEIDLVDAAVTVDGKIHDEYRVTWIKFMDAVKRMYPGAKLLSLDPLVVQHSELTVELLGRIPWQELPRR